MAGCRFWIKVETGLDPRRCLILGGVLLLRQGFECDGDSERPSGCRLFDVDLRFMNFGNPFDNGEAQSAARDGTLFTPPKPLEHQLARYSGNSRACVPYRQPDPTILFAADPDAGHPRSRGVFDCILQQVT